VVIIWAILTLTFLLTRLSGDPVVLFLDTEDLAKPEIVAEARRRLGLDQPLIVQYGRFMEAAARGDFGVSLRHREPALGLILERLPATGQLATVSLLLAVVLAIPAGTWAALQAYRRRRLAAAPVMIGTLVAQSTPSFWLGIMLMLFFGVLLRWLPISGRGTALHLIMPAVALAVGPAAYFTRLTRSGLLDVLSKEFITVARAKGLSGITVLSRHAFRNAAIPLVTAIGLSFGRLLSGTVVIETVFAWPGIGRLAVQAVFNRDFPVVQAAVFVGGLIFVLINLVMDFVYVLIDPRIRYQ
jgi:ABC-type dipeptide/oligopeptide/nickel transport system permease component